MKVPAMRHGLPEILGTRCTKMWRTKQLSKSARGEIGRAGRSIALTKSYITGCHDSMSQLQTRPFTILAHSATLC